MTDPDSLAVCDGCLHELHWHTKSQGCHARDNLGNRCPCRAAERAREAARPKRTHAEKLAGRKTPLQPCGTRAARQRHWKRNETCWVCWTGDVS